MEERHEKAPSPANEEKGLFAAEVEAFFRRTCPSGNYQAPDVLHVERVIGAPGNDADIAAVNPLRSALNAEPVSVGVLPGGKRADDGFVFAVVRSQLG